MSLIFPIEPDSLSASRLQPLSIRLFRTVLTFAAASLPFPKQCPIEISTCYMSLPKRSSTEEWLRDGKRLWCPVINLYSWISRKSHKFRHFWKNNSAANFLNHELRNRHDCISKFVERNYLIIYQQHNNKLNVYN